MSSIRTHWYIAREIAIPTLIGLVTFTFVLIMGRVLKLVEMILNKGVPFSEIAQLVAFLLPAFLVVTIPLSLLLGVLLGFGRLSADSEIVALKSTGTSIYSMVKPVMIIALLASMATSFLTIYAVPAGNSAFRSLIFKMATNRASLGLQPRVFNDEFDGLVLYANNIDEMTGAMKGVFISDERSAKTPSIILANRGRIISDEKKLSLTMHLEEGTIHRRPSNKGEENYQLIDFSTYDIKLNMGEQLASPKQRSIKLKELTLGELNKRIEGEENPSQLKRLSVEIHKRFTLPLAPLVFGLIGVPLGIQSHRSGRGGGFTLALGTFLAYYMLTSLSEALSIEGNLPPLPTLWIPNIIFFLGGAYLLHRTAMEKRLSILDFIIGAPLWVTRKLRNWRGGR